MRWLFLIVLPMGIGAFVAMTSPEKMPWLHNWSVGAAPAPEERETPAVAVNKRPLIFASGIIEGAQRDVPLRFEIAGRLAKVNVNEGQQVKQGEVLAVLGTETLKKQLEFAQAKLALAKSERTRLSNGERPETIEVAKNALVKIRVQLETAKQGYQRGLELQKKNAITAEAFEERRSAYQAALAEQQLENSRIKEIEAPAREDDLIIADAKIAQAEAELGVAQTELKKAELVAPTDGMILRVGREPGQMVGPQDLQPLLVMVDASQMRTRAYVEELDALAVKPGQHAYVTADGDPETKFHGKVVSCSPLMVPKKYMSNEPGERIDVKVREVVIVLDEQNTLVVGLPVDVFIETGEDQEPEASESKTDTPEVVTTDNAKKQEQRN